jgi:hypothetical protein
MSVGWTSHRKKYSPDLGDSNWYLVVATPVMSSPVKTASAAVSSV